MRIFITGGTGFIGRPTVLELQKCGHQLLLLAPESRRESSERFGGRGIPLTKGDLGNPKKWEVAVKRFRPEAALHMAWEGLPDYGEDISEKNLIQGLRFYRLLGKIGCKKVVTTGSCWEYGIRQGKLSEDMPLHPFNAFSAAKNALHWFGECIAGDYDMQFIWTRLFFVYGPGQRKESLIPYLISCKKMGIKPEIKNPNKGNDFIYVNDIALALGILLEKRIKGSGVTYNIGAGRLISNVKVLNTVYGKKICPRLGLCRSRK